MAATPKVIRIGATMDVSLRRLRHDRTEVFEPGATVTYTLFTGAGDPVLGATDVPMSFVAGAQPDDGIYLAELDAVTTADLTDGESYTILMLASAPGSIMRPFPLACIARL